MDRELLKKYIRNECSPEELKEVLGWFEKSAATKEGKFALSELWRELPDKGNYAYEAETVDYERILDRIHHDVNLSQTFSKKKGRGVRRSLQFLSRVAAVLFIPLLFLSIYMTMFKVSVKRSEPLFTEIISPNGSRIHMSLPDGTKVWLNNGSRLKFPLKFSGKVRRVELTGEAFFEVARNKKIPFVVKAGALSVVATGTAFDVMAYPEDKKIETTLKEGEIVICKELPGGKTRRLMVMKPNEHAVYRKQEGKLYYNEENPDKYISWMEGRLIFRNDPLDVVVKRLSRWYNVDIVAKDPRLARFTYTATFVDETLPQVLELLRIATPIDYKMIPRKKLPDGSFSRGQVVIRYAQKNRKK